MTEEWKRSYGARGTGEDRAVGVVVDASGNTYVTGTSKGNGTLTDIATIKYGSQGKVLWTRRYNGTGKGTDEASAIALDSQGNVYVTGSSYGGARTGRDFITLKYDPSGKLLWQKRYNGPGNGEDRATAIAVDTAGNVYVTGESYGDGLWFDYATLKYDPSGNLLWEKRYNGPGDVMIALRRLPWTPPGTSMSPATSLGGGSAYDYATLKYDASGNLLWEKRYNGPGNGDDPRRRLPWTPPGTSMSPGHRTGTASHL